MIQVALNSSSQNRNGQRNQGGRGGGGGPFGGFFPGQQPQQNGSQQSERALLQAKVVAVGDPRTNALVVTAARETMTQIAETVGRLDATDAKKQRVFVHQLEHADVESAANVLRGMLGDQSAITTTQGGNRLQNRSSNGATMDTSDVSNTGTGGGGGGRAGR